MKSFHLFIFVFMSSILFGQTNNKSSQKETASLSKKEIKFLKKGFPKKLNKAIGELQYIPGGTFNMGQIDPNIRHYPQKPNRDGVDTFLISIPGFPKRVTLSSFLIGATEVTNLQYREFVHWVRDSIAHRLMGHIKERAGGEEIDWEHELDWSKDGLLAELFYTADEQLGSEKSINVSKLIYASGDYKEDKALQIYPDTLSCISYFPYLYSNKMVRNNFWDSNFDNFPVVGVSWDQAMAYCDWKTHQINKLLAKHGYPPIQLRLPTEAEWEYAALALEKQNPTKNEQISDIKLFPWKGSKLTDENGNYRANFGNIHDETGAVIKSFPEGPPPVDKDTKNHKNYFKISTAELEQGLYTTAVKQYAAYGELYGMAGNVSEWVMDAPRLIWQGASISEEVEMYDLNPFRGNISPQEKDSSTQTTNKEEEPIYQDSLNYILYQADSVEVMQYFFDKWRTSSKDNRPSFSLEEQSSVDIHFFENYWHDIKVIYRSGTKKRIGKGGSWAESNINLYSGAKAAYTQSSGYPFVGFRVAATFSLSNE